MNLLSTQSWKPRAGGGRFAWERIRATRLLALAWLDGPRLFDRLPTTAWYSEMGDLLVQAMAPSASDHWLDLGCGTGRQAIHVSRLVGKVTAVDRSAAMLAWAQRNQARFAAAKLRLLREDGEALSFKDDSFDLASGFMLLPMFRDPTRVLGELSRVVRPGGRIGLLVPSESLTPLAAWEFAELHGFRGFDKDSLVAWAHTSRRYTRDELRRWLRLHADRFLRILPLLDGMALAAVFTRPPRDPAA